MIAVMNLCFSRMETTSALRETLGKAFLCPALDGKLADYDKTRLAGTDSSSCILTQHKRVHNIHVIRT